VNFTASTIAITTTAADFLGPKGSQSTLNYVILVTIAV
jgi:hypothetical protein